MIFDARYREDTTLEDGQPIRLRLLRPDDKALMVAAWTRLSPASRYRRFLSAKTELSARELAYFTEMDQVDHFAIGAERLVDGKTEALGVARFVRLASARDTADASIAVTDDVHGKGLGRMLLSRLVAAARERGIDYFVSDVLTSNVEMRGLFKSLSPEAIEEHDGETVVVRIPLAHALATTPPQPTMNNADPISRLLAFMAAGRARLTVPDK